MTKVDKIIRFGLMVGLALWAALTFAHAATQTQAPMSQGQQQFSDGNGAPYAGGSLYFYVPGTTTPKATWADPYGSSLNTNPLLLDANGRGIVWGSGLYRQVLKDQFGNTIWDQQVYAQPPLTFSASAICASQTTTGSANAQVLTPTTAQGAYVIGEIYCGIAGFTNTGTMTLQVSALTPEPVEKQSSAGLVALVGGEVIVGQAYMWSWDGTEFQLLNPTALPVPAVTSAEAINVSPTYCAYGSLNNVTTPWASWTDNTACVQAAINAACSALSSASGYPSGKLVFSKGAYYLKSGVTIPAACGGLLLVGQGIGNGGNLASSGTWIFSDNNCVGPVVNFYPDATQNYVYGGGVEDIAFYNAPWNGSRDGSVSCKYPIIQALFGEEMRFQHLYAWLPYQFEKLIAGLHLVTYDVVADQVLQDSPGLFEFFGTGATSAVQTTRQDQVYVNKVFAGSSAALTSGHKWFTGVWWHGLSNTVQLDHVAFEGVYQALKIDCTYGGATDISGCPSFLVANDFEAEAAGGNMVDAQDFQILNFVNSYFHCFGSSVNGGCNDTIKLYNGSFAATADAVFTGGQIDSAQHACLDAEMQGLVVTGVAVFGCNAGASGGGGIIIESPVGSDAKNQHVLSGNTFCAHQASTPVAGMTGIILESGNDYIVANNNVFMSCGTGITNSSGGSNVATSGNVGP